MTQLSLDSGSGSGAASGGKRAYLAPVVWGVVVGGLQAASPLVFWWLDAATVYAVGLAVIAAIYVGFAVADGRRQVIAVESAVATVFIVVATAAITGSPWLLVLGFVGHGLKDLWQHRQQFVETPIGGLRSASWSTGSWLRRSSSRSSQASASISSAGGAHREAMLSARPIRCLPRQRTAGPGSNLTQRSMQL